MKLPIPIKYNNKIYDDIELKDYTAGTIAETQKAGQASIYRAIAVFVTGCIKTINGEAEKGLIRDIIGHMPFKTAEFAYAKALEKNGDGGIEGTYLCPRCHKKMICEKTDSSDNRDFVSQIPVNYASGEVKINVDLDSPIEIPEAKEDEIQDVISIQMAYPTLSHLANASGKWTDAETFRIELQTYVEATEGISGGPIDRKWLSRYGMLMMERLSMQDLKKIKEKIKEYGMNLDVKKKCPDCGKEFEATINVSWLFLEALR